MPASDLKPKVFQWLDSMFNSVQWTDSGTILVPGFGSTALFVSVQDVFNNQYVQVRVDAPILLDVPITSELLQYIGVKSSDYVFGSLALLTDSDAAQTAVLCFRQSLLGDALDQVELQVATQVVALTADDLDDNLKRRFGGRRFHE